MRNFLNRETILKYLFAIFILGYLLLISDTAKMAETISSIKLEIYFFGLLLFIATYIPSVLRWELISTNLGYEVGTVTSFKIISVSYAVNRVFPGNAGDLVRSKIMEKYEEVESHPELLGGVAAERFQDVAVLVPLVLISSLATSISLLEGYFTLIFVFIPILVTATILLIYQPFKLEKLRNMPFLGSKISDIVLGYRKSSLNHLKSLMALSTLKWVLEVLAFFYFALSIGAGLGVWEAALITSVMTLISSLPITPSGLGAVEAVASGMLVLTGMTYSAALSLIILQRTASIILVVLLGLCVYLSTQ